MKKNLILAHICTGYLLLSVGGTAQAQAKKQAVPTLEEIMVAGESTDNNNPIGTKTVDSKELENRSINSWEDFAKRGDPSISYNQTNKSINIRGLDSDRIITSIDGIKIPWLNDGSRNVQGGVSSIEFSSLSAIDLVKGTGAAASGALTGAVELRTLSPEDLLTADKEIGVLAKTGYDNADNSWMGNAAIAGRLGNGTSWLLQAGRRHGHELKNMGDSGGYGATRETPDPSSYSQNNVLLKLQHAWNNAHKVTLTGETFRYKSDTDSLSSQGINDTYKPGYGKNNEEIKRDRVSLGYAYLANNENSAIDKADIKAYWQRLSLQEGTSGIRNDDARANIIPGDPFMYGYPSGKYSRDNHIKETTIGTIGSLDGYIHGATTHHWAIGADISSSKLSQRSSGFDNCPEVPAGLPELFGPRTCGFLHTNQADMPEVDGLNWSIWAQNEFSWQDGKYALTPALRFDSYKWDPKSGGNYSKNPNLGNEKFSQNSSNRFSPSLLASYKAKEDLTFYAKYGYGFKAPNATQLYLNYGGPGTYLRLGNPNLKPEISHGWEIGVIAGNEELGAQLALFDNRYRDYIDNDIPVSPGSDQWQNGWDSTYPLGVSSYANRARVRIFGAELSGHWEMTTNWYTRGAISWTQGKDQGTGEYLNSVAPLKAALALGYKTSEWGVEGLLSAAAARNKVQNQNKSTQTPYPDFKAPGYGVIDISSWWTPQTVRGLRIQAGVYNLFDRKYWNALNVPTQGTSALPRSVNYYTEPGRSVRISLSYQY